MVDIDVDRKFTPRRVQKKKKQIITTFSDHFALKIELSGIPKTQEISRIETSWNLGKLGGWDSYEKVSNEAAEMIDTIVKNHELDINNIMKKLDTIDTKLRFRFFGKTKPSVRSTIKRSKWILKCQNFSCDQCKNQNQKDEELHERQTQRIELAIQKIKESKLGRVGNVYMMKRQIAGPKKTH